MASDSMLSGPAFSPSANVAAGSDLLCRLYELDQTPRGRRIPETWLVRQTISLWCIIRR